MSDQVNGERMYEIPASQAARIVNELRWARLRYVDAQLEIERERAPHVEDLTQAQLDDVVIHARIGWDQSYPTLAELRRTTLRGAS